MNAESGHPLLDRTALVRGQDRAASEYARHARVPDLVAERLLERLDGLKLVPRRVLDVGCGPGTQARRLAAKFPEADVIALDLSRVMLRTAGRERGWLRRCFDRVQADAAALPIADSSIDLLFCSLALHGCDSLAGALNGFRRVLKPGGLLLLTHPGLDTWRELRRATEDAGGRFRVGRFVDVQKVGDALVRAGFSEPVLDTDWIRAGCRHPRALLDELRATGFGHAGCMQPHGLATPRQLERLFEHYPSPDPDAGGHPVTWEIV
ncbi:MAG: methyltransferase domain-containing protein, partial [Wenzhouxiangellaceae bacterium]